MMPTTSDETVGPAAAPVDPALLAAVVAHSKTCLAVVTGRELRFTLVNPAYQAIAPGEPMLGRTYGEVFPEAAASGSRERLLGVLDTGEPWEVDRWRAPAPGKPDATWQGRVVRLPLTPGEPPSALVVIDDVTAQARAEEALRLETAKYRGLFEHSLDAVYLALPDGTILDANGAACRLHGMTLDELRRAGRAGLVVQDEHHAAALRARAHEGHVRSEMTVRRKDGTTVPVEVESVLLDPARQDSPAFVISRDVSSRRRREAELTAALDELRESEDRFRAVFEAASDAVLLADPRGPGRVLLANAAACRLFGYTEEEFRHVDRSQLLDAADPGLAAFLAARDARRQSGPTELTYLRKDGSRFTGEIASAVFRNRDGEGRSVAIIRDVTERKRAADALVVSEAALAQAGAMAHLGAWWIDLAASPGDVDASPLHWSAEVYRIFGYAPGEVAVSNALFFRHVHPDDRARISEAVARAIATRSRYALEHRIVRRSGEERVVLEHGEAQYDEAGRPVRLVGAVQDVTSARRAEEAIREGEARYRTLFTNMTEGFALGEVTCDDAGVPRDFRFVEMNEAFEHQSGLGRDRARGRSIREVLPNLESSWVETYGAVALGAPPVRFESHNRDLDRHFSVYCFSPARGRFAILFTDVTDRRRAEAALRASEETFRSVFERAAIGMGRVRFSDARWVDVNDAFCRMLGRSREELLRRPWPEITHPEDVDLDLASFRRMAAGELESYTVEKRFVHADGRDVWAKLTLSLVRDASGRPEYEIAIIEDIGDRKRAEQALRDADRRKDEFLGMLSHELRNPLAPIRNALYILDRAEPTGQQARRAKDVANRQVAHLTRLVDDLLDVTRIARGRIELRRSDLDLAALARRTADDYRALMQDRGLELRVELPDEPVLVNGDDTRLAQVLGNLLSNAAKFTPAGGRVSLSMAVREGSVAVHVRDTGPGIAPDVLPTIFEPFTQAQQTLARSEGGLGLGLALVRGLVALHGGAVSVSSDGEAGSDFEVTLPLARRPARAAPGGGPARREGARRRRVLVVDDSADAADTLAQLVAMMGHDAEVAYDGPSAVAAARARAPDVVLCDLGLPGMDGYEVARRLRELPGAPLRLVAVSGYAQPEDVARAVEAGFDAHVAKPPDPAELAKLLE